MAVEAKKPVMFYGKGLKNPVYKRTYCVVLLLSLYFICCCTRRFASS
ncbi:MAG: hypothetical protein H6Q48_3388 [Deltaproteobacteria bacterium]|nr:hypothetical protein [Deltaproteobacteria bacterium]